MHVIPAEAASRAELGSRTEPFHGSRIARGRPGMTAVSTQDIRSKGGRAMNISKFFIDRPIFAGVLSVLIFLAGPDLAARPADLGISGSRAADRSSCAAQYPGANPRVIAETVATPIEEQINGVEGMLYMSSQATTDGVMTLTVTFKLGTDPDKAQQLVQNRVSQAEPRLPEEVRRLGVTTVKSSPDLMMVVHLTSPNGRYDMTYLRNYARAERQGPAGPHRRRRPGPALRLGRLFDARLARPAEGRRARPLAGRRRPRDPRPERPGRRRRHRRLAERARARPAALGQRAGPPAERGGVRRHHRQDRRRRRGHAAARRRPHRARRGRLCAALAAQQQAGRRRAGLPGAGLERHRDLRQRPRDDGEIKQNMPEGVDYAIVYDTTQFVRASIKAVITRCSRRSRSSCSSSSSSCRPGAPRSSRWSPCRSRSSAPSR